MTFVRLETSPATPVPVQLQNFRLLEGFAYFRECPLIEGLNEFSGPWGARSGGAWRAIPGLYRANTNPREMYPINSARERCRRVGTNRDGKDGSICASGIDSSSETRCAEMSGSGADAGAGDPG